MKTVTVEKGRGGKDGEGPRPLGLELGEAEAGRPALPSPQ